MRMIPDDWAESIGAAYETYAKTPQLHPVFSRRALPEGWPQGWQAEAEAYQFAPDSRRPAPLTEEDRRILLDLASGENPMVSSIAVRALFTRGGLDRTTFETVLGEFRGDQLAVLTYTLLSQTPTIFTEAETTERQRECLSAFKEHVAQSTNAEELRSIFQGAHAITLFTYEPCQSEGANLKELIGERMRAIEEIRKAG